ncbi:hypothetical protein B1R32_10954 [Abditibacterium utsteinense]|uniref:Uncharacterized protein n=1 Tax=Abditibacterium utsteinense TaxID=1960156 RepID=A0A2S8SSE6_9BACT|nr:hypothetical protein [Abditibacterium utsteinense]PQV63715.1 hypothetical protein B1R32_10954 [Abditibacterium utsteinense]
MKRRIRMSEWALLVAPCLMLAGLGWWQNQAKNQYPTSSDSTAPTILKAKIEPVTPFDVSEGWDTRFEVVAQVPQHLRPAPGNFSTSAQADLMNTSLHFQSGNRNVVLPISSNRKMFQYLISNGETTNSTLLMRLRDLSTPSSPVTLHADVIAHYWRAGSVNGISRNINTQSNPIAIKAVVQRGNERTTLPAVSHVRPFALENTSVEHRNSYFGKILEADTTVEMIFTATDPSQPQFMPMLHNLRLVDERGREYRTFLSPTTKRWVSPRWSSTNTNESPDGKYHQWMSFPVGFLPKSAGRITFKTDVSVNDCWPLPVSIEVRAK